MINSLSLDFLIRIKNAYKAGRKSITAPASKLSINIAQLLKKYGYVADYSVIGESIKEIKVSLFKEDNDTKINNVKIFSKPGRRIYEKSSSLPWGQTADSLIIISTSSGLMSQKEAKKRGVGGEIIAEVY